MLKSPMDFSSNQPQKGMLDEFPWDLARTRFVENKIRAILESFHYLEYDAPVLEDIELFAKKSGDELVREQAYTLTDKGQRELVLRPEMTPSLARMISQISREKPRPYRWYAIPKCYRYERPQKGRLREFRQLNVDLMGDESIHSDFEMCRLVVKIMRAFGVPDTAFQIRFNHRGLLNALLENWGFTPEKQKLFYRLADRKDKLPKEVFDAEAAKGLGPMEVDFLGSYLDGGSDYVNSILQDPKFAENPAAIRWKEWNALVAKSDLASKVVFSPQTVRGLDYYTGLVFEVYATGESISRALFGGGRYDNLLGMFSQEQVSGIGFGMGVAIFSIFLEELGLLPKENVESRNLVLVHPMSPEASFEAELVADKLRAENWIAEMSFYTGGLKKVLQKAESRGFTHIALLGEEELRSRRYSMKDLKSGVQTQIDF